MKYELTVEIDGEDWGDLDLALQQVLKYVRQECYSGSGENDTGSYSFSIREKD